MIKITKTDKEVWRTSSPSHFNFGFTLFALRPSHPPPHPPPPPPFFPNPLSQSLNWNINSVWWLLDFLQIKLKYHCSGWPLISRKMSYHSQKWLLKGVFKKVLKVRFLTGFASLRFFTGNRPFSHCASMSKHKKMRARLGWTNSYKSLYFVHPRLNWCLCLQNAGLLYNSNYVKICPEFLYALKA